MAAVFRKFFSTFAYVTKYACIMHCTFEFVGDVVIVSKRYNITLYRVLNEIMRIF